MSIPRSAPRRLFAAALPVALLAFSMCADSEVDKWRKALARAEASWRSAGIRDYEMDIIRLCFCVAEQTRPVTATVRGGAFVSLVYTDSGGTPADTTLFQQYLTMDRVFAVMSSVLDTEPASLHAEYHPAYGYPILWAVDPDAHIADEEFSIQVFAFRRTPAASAAARRGAGPDPGR